MKRQIFSKAPFQSLLFLLSFLLLNIETQAGSSTVVASERMPTVSMLVYAGLLPTILAEVNWEEFKRIKRGVQPGEAEALESVVAPTKDFIQCPGAPPADDVDSHGCIIQPESDPETPVLTAITCPDATTYTSNSGARWFLCDLPGSEEYSPYGVSHPISYMIPKAENFADARLRIYLHPSNPSGSFVTGSSSFAYRQDTVEIHPAEQQFSGGGTGWWGYSGFKTGKVGNYNGNQIAAGIDYVLDKYPDRIAMEKGIYLLGKSLGGAGAFIQALIMPKYQDKIAIADNIIGMMMAPKNHEDQLKGGWGTKAGSPDLYDAADIRLHWDKIQDIHFAWRGGANDNFSRFDLEFIEICEQRKISCSLTWLQSGHGISESGYNLNMQLWTDPNQDATLDKILPVITSNSSNHHGELRGYHNRGVTWNHSGIVDSADQIVIPLKYEAMTDLGPDLPDQPERAIFSVTPRHVKNFPMAAGNTVSWVFGGLSGTAVVGSDGLVTIDDLALQTGTGYHDLIISIEDEPKPPVVVDPAPGEQPIVYTRVPRTHGEHTVALSSGEYTSDNWDYMDALPEVARQFDGFNAPGQLVLRDTDGTEKIIYDCMDKARPCVPFDAMPSLDGSKIAFSVYSANGLKPPWPENRNYPPKQLNGSNADARIYIYDIASETLTAWPHNQGNKDISPVWLPNGKMLFGSTRNGFYAPYLDRIGTSKAPEPRLFIADLDGSNVVDISPHEVTAALHPYLLNSGRVAYSSHWLSHNLAYGSTNGGVNWPGTTSNFWSIMDMDYRGGDMTALLGAHKSRLTGSNPRSNTMKAMHFLGQRANNDICTVNYYRANNLGLGDVICWPPAKHGIEGPAPGFVPSGHYSAAVWSTSEDAASRKDTSGRYLGKVGWPEGTPDNQLLLSVGRGYCTQVATGVPGTPDKIGDDIGCDVGLYKTTVIPSQSPDDLTLIVDHPEWHEFSARVVVSRDIPTPALTNTDDHSCQITSSDAGSTDALNYKGYVFNEQYKTVNNDGALMEAVDHGELAAIRFYEIIPNTTRSRNWDNSIGNRVKLLGDVPLLADKSFKAELPCETPYIMVGVDADGRAIKRDQVPQSLRTGEKRVCLGCHLHGEEGRPYEQSLAFNAQAFDLTKAMSVPTYTKDIKPILDAKCTSCHAVGGDVPLYDYQNLVWDFSQKALPEHLKVQMTSSTNETRKYGLQRPYTSKYVNNMYARESLLYWKAANKRTDGRTDDLYADDIDFGADHPVDLMPSEVDLIGEWLDSGAAE